MTFSRFVPSRRIGVVFPWVVAALALATIAPALWSGWIGDDAFYSALDGNLGVDRRSLWDAILRAHELWFFGTGRLYPGLILEKYAVFALFTNLLAYKLLLVAATLVSIEMFRRCVALYATPGLANLAALLVAAMLALRGYHDPILSFNAMPQLVAIALLGSLIAFRHGLASGARPWRALSILLYAVAALTYEEAFAFSLLYVALALGDRRGLREALARAWPYLAVAILLTLVSCAARTLAHVPADSPYGVNLRPDAVLQTLGLQMLAALPLSYYLLDPSHIFSRANAYDFYNNAPLQPAVFLAFAVAAAYALAAASRERFDPRGPIVVGAATLVLGALPISALVKYQHELKPGLGYLPVLYEQFGVALAFAAIAVATIRGSKRRLWATVWAVGIALVATFTQATNVRVVREDAGRAAARASLERQLRSGLLASIPDGTYVTIAQPPDWVAFDGQGPEGISTRGLFFTDAGKRIHLVAPSDPRARVVLIYDAKGAHWSIVRRWRRTGEGISRPRAQLAFHG